MLLDCFSLAFDKDLLKEAESLGLNTKVEVVPARMCIELNNVVAIIENTTDFNGVTGLECTDVYMDSGASWCVLVPYSKIRALLGHKYQKIMKGNDALVRHSH